MQLEIVYKEMPEKIDFIFTEICNRKYGIINESLTPTYKALTKEACQYLHKLDSGNALIRSDEFLNSDKTDGFLHYLKEQSMHDLYDVANEQRYLKFKGEHIS